MPTTRKKASQPSGSSASDRQLGVARRGRPRRDTSVSNTVPSPREPQPRTRSCSVVLSTRMAQPESATIAETVDDDELESDNESQTSATVHSRYPQPVATFRNQDNDSDELRPTVRRRNRNIPDHHVAFQDGQDQQLPSPCTHDATGALEARGFGSSTPIYLRETQPRVANRLCHPGRVTSMPPRSRLVATNASRSQLDKQRNATMGTGNEGRKRWIDDDEVELSDDENIGTRSGKSSDRPHGPVVHTGTRSGVGVARGGTEKSRVGGIIQDGVAESGGNRVLRGGMGRSAVGGGVPDIVEEEDDNIGACGGSERTAQPNIKELMTVLNALEQGSDEWYSVFEIIQRVRKTTSSVIVGKTGSDACAVGEQAQPAKKDTVMSQPDSSLSEKTVSQPEKKSSSSPQLKKCENKKSIKLTEFDGTTPWPMFSLMFENCSKINGWDESERLIHLQLALQGAAQQMMWTDGRADWTSAALLAELAERFSPESQADQYRALLSTRRRHKGETISDLGQDIQRLAALAFPGPRDQTKEMFAIDAFLRAVSNKDLGFHMKRTASVKTLTEAIRYAQQYEAFHRDSDDDELTYNTVRKEKKTKVAATAGDKEVRSTRESELEKEVHQLQEKLKTQQQQATQSELELTKKLAEVTTRDRQQFDRNRNSPRGGGQSQRRNDSGDMDNVSILCFNCGGPGHISRNCQKGRWNNRGAARGYSRGGFQNRGATGNRNSATGYNSDSYRGAGNQNSATAYESKDLGATGNQAKKDSATGSEPVKTTTAGGQSTYWTRPVMLEVKMNGSRRFCLIDTGCHTTMIPPSCAKGLRLKRCDSVYTNASDDVMKISGVATVRIRLDDKILDIDAVVSPDCSEPMLGYDWLRKYRVAVLPHEGVVSIDGTKYQLQPRNRDPESCNVVAKESRVIPPHSAVIVGSSLRICNVMERTPQPHKSDWMAEPYEIRQGVFVGRMLFLERLEVEKFSDTMLFLVTVTMACMNVLVDVLKSNCSDGEFVVGITR